MRLDPLDSTALSRRKCQQSANAVLSVMSRAWFALLPLIAACGSSAPTPGPSPVPSPSGPISVTATLTDTVSGAIIGQLVQSVTSFPAQLTIAQAGYVTRSTWVSSAEPRIDLFPEAGFDLTFYRQFARGTLDGAAQPLRVLAQAPSIYLQTAGLSAANVAALEAAARATLPALTGGRFQVTTWETGETLPADRAGWVTVELYEDATGCGRASVGASRGHVWMNTAARCAYGGYAVHPAAFGHELGHALGYWHVESPGHLMHRGSTYGAGTAVVSNLERHHGALAYTRQAGNQDVDADPRVPASFQTVMVVD